MPRFIKRLLLFVATLGAGAQVYNLMRAEGERALRRMRREPRPLPPLEPSRAARKPAPVPDHAPADPAPPAAEAARTAAKVTEPDRCVATKKSGERCSRETQPGSQYCWQHGG
jgi:hypothetical protein